MLYSQRSGRESLVALTILVDTGGVRICRALASSACVQMFFECASSIEAHIARRIKLSQRRNAKYLINM